MATEAKAIEICNSALVLIGGTDNAINTFSDDTRESRICAQLYPTTKGMALTRHPWKFTLGQQQLARLVDQPLFGYEYAHQLPTDPKALTIVKVNDESGQLLRTFSRADARETQSYRVVEDKIYSNSEEIFVLYQFEPDEEDFPPYFTEVLEFYLAEKLALALEQDETLADRMAQRASARERKARHIDSRNDPPFKIPHEELVLTSVR